MAERPSPPEGLSDASRKRWETFWRSPAAKKVDRLSDMPRLVRWIEQSDEYDQVAALCRRERIVKGSTGQPRLNPLIGYLAQLDGQLARTEAEFGMTPLARQRLREDLRPPLPETPTADGVDELNARRKAKASGG
ncbi:P27 family phage terminase small subunit [Micromonospora sp. NPDC000207]|uniref:P27 family phage terminase small subunit n=1 Tax=Micromonospora sp. NPDC000207 TaxID=3154246 RepID=UPI00331EECDE